MKRILVVFVKDRTELTAVEMDRLLEELKQKLRAPEDVLNQKSVTAGSAKAQQKFIGAKSKSAWTDDACRN